MDLPYKTDRRLPCPICGTTTHVMKKHFINHHHIKAEKYFEENNITIEQLEKQVLDKKMEEWEYCSVCGENKVHPNAKSCSIECRNKNPEFSENISSGLKKSWSEGKITNWTELPENKEKMMIRSRKQSETAKKRYKTGEIVHWIYKKSKEGVEEYCIKMSKITSSRLVNGGGTFKGDYVSVRSGKLYHFRSSWEKAFMEFLDDCIYVEYWDYEKYVIPYISSEDTARNYLPDFFVKFTNRKELYIIEIGPDYSKRKKREENTKCKFRYAEEFCKYHGYKFVVLTEKDFDFNTKKFLIEWIVKNGNL